MILHSLKSGFRIIYILEVDEPILFQVGDFHAIHKLSSKANADTSSHIVYFFKAVIMN